MADTEQENQETGVESTDTAAATPADTDAEQAPQTSEDPEVAILQEQLAAAEAQVSEFSDQMLRARAEVENMRRRMERDVEKARKFALENFSQELLAVLDSLELGLVAGKDENATIEKLIEGTELTLKMFKSVLEKFNVKEVDPHGQVFDPELHQAMTMQESVEHEPHTVMEVFQKGYTLHDRLIRPARVVVAKPPQEEKNSSESGETA